MAGGLTRLANTDNLNIAQIIEGNSCIVISSRSDNDSYTLSIGEEKNKININTASFDELVSLQGIGEKKANSIIEYRKRNGFFKSIDEIKNVEGIGDALFNQIKEDICVW